jgi:hypothetical protein
MRNNDEGFDEYDEATPGGPGTDENGDGSVAIARLVGSGRAVMLPTSLRKASADQQEVAADLQRAALEILDAVAELGRLVDEARSAGLSWESIGWCVGRSGRAVQKRWGGER